MSTQDSSPSGITDRLSVWRATAGELADLATSRHRPRISRLARRRTGFAIALVPRRADAAREWAASLREALEPLGVTTTVTPDLDSEASPTLDTTDLVFLITDAGTPLGLPEQALVGSLGEGRAPYVGVILGGLEQLKADDHDHVAGYVVEKLSTLAVDVPLLRAPDEAIAFARKCVVDPVLPEHRARQDTYVLRGLVAMLLEECHAYEEARAVEAARRESERAAGRLDWENLERELSARRRRRADELAAVCAKSGAEAARTALAALERARPHEEVWRRKVLPGWYSREHEGRLRWVLAEVEAAIKADGEWLSEELTARGAAHVSRDRPSLVDLPSVELPPDASGSRVLPGVAFMAGVSFIASRWIDRSRRRDLLGTASAAVFAAAVVGDRVEKRGRPAALRREVIAKVQRHWADTEARIAAWMSDVYISMTRGLATAQEDALTFAEPPAESATGRARRLLTELDLELGLD